ncbi:MAG: helix-turn-helix transcriptional regulator [Eubacterium sp.]|nr:helix-turn-helix transcriptional regulator [Eubacterium sp.]
MDMIPVIDMVGTGKNIALLRKQAGLTVRDLQDIFGFGTPQAIYKWQQGVAMPTIDNLVVLSAVFKVSLEDILVFQKDSDIRKTA